MSNVIATMDLTKALDEAGSPITPVEYSKTVVRFAGRSHHRCAALTSFSLGISYRSSATCGTGRRRLGPSLNKRDSSIAVFTYYYPPRAHSSTSYLCSIHTLYPSETRIPFVLLPSSSHAQEFRRVVTLTSWVTGGIFAALVNPGERHWLEVNLVQLERSQTRYEGLWMGVSFIERYWWWTLMSGLENALTILSVQLTTWSQD